MTAGRRKPFVAAAAVMIALLVALLPSSAAAFGPPTESVVGQVAHHHLTVPGLVRAEAVSHDLSSDGVLSGALLAGLALLCWALRRSRHAAVWPVLLPIRAGRGPPPAR